MSFPSTQPPFRFRCAELAEQLAALLLVAPQARADRRGRVVAAPGVRLVLPALAPAATPMQSAANYLAHLPDAAALEQQRHAILLMRAGAASFGYWDGGDLIDHKAWKSYVVRGHGKAQTTYLRTRGKSRYGSRLRLQNWASLLEQVGERLRAAWQANGEPQRILLSMPVRIAVDLWGCAVPPPFSRDDARVSPLAVHVHCPDHGELLAVHRTIAFGQLLRD